VLFVSSKFFFALTKDLYAPRADDCEMTDLDNYGYYYEGECLDGWNFVFVVGNSCHPMHVQLESS